MRLSRLVPLAVFALAAAASPAQERPVAFVGATVMPVSAPPIADGVVVVQNGRITAVGPAASTAVPQGAEIVNALGRVIVPGLVDTHSHIGGGDGGDRSAALHPDVRLLDSFNPRSSTLWRALAGGITTVNAMPGSGLLMSGQTLYLKIRRTDSPRVEDLLFCTDPATEVCGGLKMANGTNPLGDGGSRPGTRARSAAAARALFLEAQAYRDRRMRDSTGARDLRMETLVEVLDGRRTVHFHTHRADDVMTVLRLAREFNFRPVLQHVSEAWQVVDEIAASGYPVSLIVLDAPGGKLEAAHIRMENGGLMERAGVPTAIHTDDYVTDSRLLFRSAALAVRAGMSREAALRALTLSGAEMLGLAGRIGSLDVGKDADLVVLSGDPFSAYTRVEQTWVEGERMFDRTTDRAYAVGGWRAYDAHDNHVHGEGASDE